MEFGIDVSPDNSTWYSGQAQGADQVIALWTTAQSGEFAFSFETQQPYVRLTATFSGAGSTPTITYQGDIELGRP